MKRTLKSLLLHFMMRSAFFPVLYSCRRLWNRNELWSDRITVDMVVMVRYFERDWHLVLESPEQALGQDTSD